MTRTQLAAYPDDKVRPLPGVTPAALSARLEGALPQRRARRPPEQQNRPSRPRAGGGGRTRSRKPSQEVLRRLVSRRHNLAHAVAGQMWGVGADTRANTSPEVVAVLRDGCPANRWDAEKRGNKSEPTGKPDEREHRLGDSFQTPVSRPRRDEAQRRVYSGQKKRHRRKTQVLPAASGAIQDIPAGHRRPVSDKGLYEPRGGRALCPGQEAGGSG
jgi:hypothetical protein